LEKGCINSSAKDPHDPGRLNLGQGMRRALKQVMGGLLLGLMVASLPGAVAAAGLPHVFVDTVELLIQDLV